ncbi:organic cation transporter protein-like [Panonychus citri]|uniref:organic cation transporter protein-like n=1 Tax=Panonychus citri TaxID=50023 RepID=UPI002307F9E2|nr:organic cation transporter protein-like [Panonychus citri]
MHFVQDIISFGIAFCLQNFFLMGIQIASYVLLMEIMPSPYQFQASVYYVGFSIVSSMIVPLIMWLISSWRYIQLAISAPGVVFFAHLWILPRSPLWLISEGKMTETENLMENLGKQNGKSMPPSFRLHLQNFLNLIKSCDGLSGKRHNIWSQFSSPSLRWYLLAHFYLFFVTYLSLNVTDSQVLRLHQTKHTDYFYRGLMDLGALTIIYHISMRIGPRPMQSIIFILSGLLMMIAISIEELFPINNEQNGYNYHILLIPSTLVSAARTLLMTLPIFIWYHTIKTLPTGIRAIGFACCFAWGVVGQMSAPNLLVLAELIAPFIPIGLCGSLSMIAGGLSLLFPDFWRKPLPNTLSDVENRSSPQTTISRSSISDGFRQIKSLNSQYIKSPCEIDLCTSMDPKTEAKLILAQNLNQQQQIQQLPLTQSDCYYDDGLTTNHLTYGGIIDVNYDNSSTINRPMMHPDIDRINCIRDSIVLSETQGSQLTELDDMVVDNGNWHLFSPSDNHLYLPSSTSGQLTSNLIGHNRNGIVETNRSFRDLQIFSNNGQTNQHHSNHTNQQNRSTVDEDENSAVIIIENSVAQVSETKL